MNQVNPNNMNKNIPTNNIQQYYESRPHKAEKRGKKMELRGLKITGIFRI